jgi:hypothetical protein
MRSHHRNLVAALLAAGLLVVAGLGSTALAHGDRQPGASAKPFPTWHPKPSGQATHKPQATKAPAKSHIPGCIIVITPTASPTPTPVALEDESGAPLAKTAIWNRDVRTWAGKISSRSLQVACSLDGLRTAAEKRADNYVRALQRLLTRVTKSKVLTDSDRAALSSEINALIADIKALRAKIHADTSLEELQPDVAALVKLLKNYRPLVKQAGLVMAADGVMAAGPRFDALVTKLEAVIAAAPDGEAKTKAQGLLDDLKAKVAEARSLAAPIPAALLAYTPEQLLSGPGAQALKDARTALAKAQKDLRTARTDAHKIIDALGLKWSDVFPKPTPKATPTAAPTT